ncbi:MAG: hypothetical protein AB7P13_07470 [Candidatus Nitrosocosmicus sp.]|jgi:hypothetical protein
MKYLFPIILLVIFGSTSHLVSNIYAQTTGDEIANMIGPALDELSKDLPLEKDPYSLYTNVKHGISFEYPSDWVIDDTPNRFIPKSDIQITNPNDKFNAFTINRDQDKTLMASMGGLLKYDQEFVKFKEENYPEERIVEYSNYSEYKIGGYETVKHTTAKGPYIIYGVESFIVDTPNAIYRITYQNSAELFDSPESQEIMNHVINSIRFLD